MELLDTSSEAKQSGRTGLEGALFEVRSQLPHDLAAHVEEGKSTGLSWTAEVLSLEPGCDAVTV